MGPVGETVVNSLVNMKTTPRSRGQAAVETALVMPLTVFIILGVIQMCLLTQSRALLKYAAYRAARAGALNNGCMDKMQESARAVLLPLMQGTSSLMNTSDMTSYMTSYAEGVLNHS